MLRQLFQNEQQRLQKAKSPTTDKTSVYSGGSMETTRQRADVVDPPCRPLGPTFSATYDDALPEDPL